MKKFLLGVLCAVSATSAFAYDCTVLLIDTPTNRIIQAFHGYRNGPADMCRDELRDCNYARRTTTNANRARCEKLDSYYSGTGTYIPGHFPAPGPVRPGPVVTPTLGRIFLEEMILDMINSQTWNDNKVDVGFDAVARSNVSHVESIGQICSSYRFDSERANCLVSTLNQGPRFMIYEYQAEAIIAACLKADTNRDRRLCFSSGSSRGRFPMIEHLLQACARSTWDDDAVRCYRQVFRI